MAEAASGEPGRCVAQPDAVAGEPPSAVRCRPGAATQQEPVTLARADVDRNQAAHVASAEPRSQSSPSSLVPSSVTVVPDDRLSKRYLLPPSMTMRFCDPLKNFPVQSGSTV